MVLMVLPGVAVLRRRPVPESSGREYGAFRIVEDDVWALEK
jgi:hypothetical protein